MKRDWITDRLNKCRWDGGGSNDDAYEAQKERRAALAADRRDRLRFLTEDVPRIESHFDVERDERERKQ